MPDILEGIIFGLIQGTTEWLPVSSEGMIALTGLKFFGKNIMDSVSLAVFLHFGTFLAAIIYFRKDVAGILKGKQKEVLKFLFLSTVVTGIVGVPVILWGLDYFGGFSANIAMGVIGVLLIVTGVVQIRRPGGSFRKSSELKTTDSVFAGALQGLASLPGFSRSGLTVAGLLLRKFEDTEALRLSFLMSLPAVFGANILFNIAGMGVDFDMVSITALVTAFVAGLFTIGLLLKVAQKMNFGWFALCFGLLVVVSSICTNYIDDVTYNYMELKSQVFKHNEDIPSKYTCDGENISPPFLITDAPEKTASFVLIMDDPDATGGGVFDHWVVWNIPSKTKEIQEDKLPEEAIEGVNDFGREEYGGPCPPPGNPKHRYFLKLYALDTTLNVPFGSGKKTVEEAMGGHVLDQVALIGLYGRE